jgi:basic membrane protein A
MNRAETEHHYLEARKLAMREYMRKVSSGQSGYLPFLEGVLKNAEILSEVDLGVVDVPLKKIAGTYTYSRSVSFAANYMPLLKRQTEFAEKWVNLCQAHLEQGIRDAIKVYEYLNWFYVVEGNKRVSVLKYFNGYSITAEVTRLMPKRDNTSREIRVYYEFLDFYKKTGINCIWFSRENSFSELTGYLKNFSVPPVFSGDKYKYFANSIYMTFRNIYHELGGGELPITTGDAFLEYIRVYGLMNDISEDDLRAKLKVFLTELRQLSRQGGVRIETEPVPARDGNIMSTIATLVRPKRVMKVAFLHAKSASQSSWTYSHEIGRAHVEKEMKGYVTTSCVENVPESPEAYRYLKRLAKDGNDVIFATSPAFINATLKAAMEFPETRFLNCSETHSYKHVNTYFGRIYEPRFLAGVVAGAATCSDILGYVGTHPEPGVISGVNSFALGARMVNPHARVLVSWTKQWDSLEKAEHASSLLIDRGADIISHHDTLSSREFSREYGVYTVVCGIDKSKCAPGDYIAVPVWNWGIFYEKIIKSIMNDMWRTVTDRLGAGQKPVNFWWGMDSGIVDFFYSKRLVPRETQKLVEFLKRMIMNGALHPFAGPVYDRKGRLRIKQNETVTHEHITTMNWLAEGVEEVGEDL